MNAGRTREIALRKVFGAGRGGIVFQFFTEAISLTLLAVALALLIVNQATANKIMNQFNLSEEELLSRIIIEEPEYTSETGEIGFPF